MTETDELTSDFMREDLAQRIDDLPGQGKVMHHFHAQAVGASLDEMDRALYAT